MFVFGGGFLNESTFHYGSELQGRGQAIKDDLIIGSIMFMLASAAVVLGIVNLLLIKKMDVFHNAFGWFWASRTFGEIMVNILHAGYNAPVTLFQPENIPVVVGIIPYILAYTFATGSCVMHSVVSLNRCIAVYSPMQYSRLFTKEKCLNVIAIMWLTVVLSAVLLVVFPCNFIGYSPTQYEYIFVKYSADVWRDYSIVGTVLKWGSKDRKFRQDIRFFAQTSVQNFTMIIATTTIVLANNRKQEDIKILQILGFNTLLLTHVNNAWSLILFNPEVRNKMCGKNRRAVSAASWALQSSKSHFANNA